MPKIGPKEAHAIGWKKYGQPVFVGNLDEVWQEARRRAGEDGIPAPGQINCDRLDGAWYDDDSDQYRGVTEKEILTDYENKYWFVLAPVQPWDQARTQVDKYADQARTWDPETQSIHELNMIIRHLTAAVDRLNHFTGQGLKIDQALDITSLPVAKAYKDQVDRKSAYPIWACDYRGYCITGDDLTGVEHISKIEED